MCVSCGWFCSCCGVVVYTRKAHCDTHTHTHTHSRPDGFWQAWDVAGGECVLTLEGHENGKYVLYIYIILYICIIHT